MNQSESPPPLDLVVVTIHTRLGETYRFPDMARREIERVIAEDWTLPTGMFTLVNISQAVLVLPIRIIAEIFVGYERKWVAP